jgi:uncharacterized SAM-binding protein YcdF (DUF218 family)
MIARFLSFLLLLYALGFIVFSVTLGAPAPLDAPKTEAAVVLTGGAGRLEYALRTISQKKATRLLISGTDPLVTKGDIARQFPRQEKVLRCCVELGSEAKDTRSNAEETERWLKRRNRTTVRLITSDWHMRRAEYEFRRVLGGGYTIVPDAVRTEPSFVTLFGEYNKYFLRRISVWFDI